MPNIVYIVRIRTIIIYVRIYLIYLYDEAHCVPNVVFKIKNTTMCVYWCLPDGILYQINNIGHYVFICCNMHANQSFTREKSLQFRRKSLNERLTNGSESSLFYSSLTNSLAIR